MNLFSNIKYFVSGKRLRQKHQNKKKKKRKREKQKKKEKNTTDDGKEYFC